MGAPPKMGQHNSQQRRLPLGLSSASQQELSATANQGPQRSISKPNRARIVPPVKRPVHPRLAKMATPPSPKRGRASELVKLSIGTGYFSRPVLELTRRKHRSTSSAISPPEVNNCTAATSPTVVNGISPTEISKTKNEDRKTSISTSASHDLGEASSGSVHFEEVVVIKQEPPGTPIEGRPVEQLMQEELLAQKDAEIKKLQCEISRLREQVARLEEQVADNESMKPPRDTLRNRFEQQRSVVSGSSARLRQLESLGKKSRKSVRLKDLTEDTKSGKAPFEEVFGDPMRPMTVMPYALYQRVIDLDEDSECRHVSGSIEVPSWREKPVECMAEGRRTSDNPSHEATGDEVYLKRHLKLETDEKRRKRWDRQWMLEQKNFERARRRQARRRSSLTATQLGAGTSLGSSQKASLGSFPRSRIGQRVNSLFPSGSRLQAVELAEQVPVVAWGCSVPQIKHREFSFK